MGMAKRTVLMIFITAAVTLSAAAVSGLGRDEAQYIVRAYDGCVAVFYGDMLVMETDVPVSSLRAADRAMVAVGIPAESRERAIMLLEDLSA